MVFIKMLQTKTAINASGAMRNGFIYHKFLFKSNTMQRCLSNYTILRVVQLQTIVLYCRRNARFPVHTSPPRKFSECAARFLVRPDWLDGWYHRKASDKITVQIGQSLAEPYLKLMTIIIFKLNGK